MPIHPLLEMLETDGRVGLEIGALHHPLLRPSDAKVLYVDHASTAELQAKYADDAEVGDMVEVDVVWGDQALREALEDVLGTGAVVDFAIASHVFEHVPDAVGWLDELAGVLRPGGMLALAIPDKRFCFDARRRLSDVADVIEAHLLRRRRPPLGATFDFWTKYDQVDLSALWDGRPGPGSGPLRDREALERTRAAADDEGYSDVHCWVFTPDSFLEIVDRLAGVDLLPAFAIAAFRRTAPGSLEFYGVFERLPELTVEERRARQLASIARFRGREAGDDEPLAIDPDVARHLARRPVVPSPREARAIMLKRRIINRLRGLSPGRR